MKEQEEKAKAFAEAAIQTLSSEQIIEFMEWLHATIEEAYSQGFRGGVLSTRERFDKYPFELKSKESIRNWLLLADKEPPAEGEPASVELIPAKEGHRIVVHRVEPIQFEYVPAEPKRMLLEILDPVGVAEITGEEAAHMMGTVTGYPNDIAVDLVKAGVARPVVSEDPKNGK